MPQNKDTGIVLSKKSSGEADFISTIYTKNSGKNRFIFKGLKKSTKRPRSASEPGTILEIIYYSGHNSGINTISEFDILSFHKTIRNSSDRIFTMYFILELVDLTTGHDDPNTNIFNLLAAGINTLENTQFPKHFALFFAVRYLLLQGVFPDTGRCSWCGNGDSDKLVIETGNLRVSCVNCTDLKNIAAGRMITEYINRCAGQKFDRIPCSDFQEKDIVKALAVIIEYVNSYYGIKLKSASMLTVPSVF